MAGNQGAAKDMSENFATGGIANDIPLSTLYKQKVQDGKQELGRAAGAQMQLLKALKSAVDDINEVDPFITLSVSAPDSSSGSDTYVNIRVREDGQNKCYFKVAASTDEETGKAQLTFTDTNKKDLSFVITEDELGNFGQSFKENLSTALASRDLEGAPKNVSTEKRAAIFELK